LKYGYGSATSRGSLNQSMPAGSIAMYHSCFDVSIYENVILRCGYYISTPGQRRQRRHDPAVQKADPAEC
jgi:hypothetical protein